MPIEFRCPSCQRLLRVPDGTAGKSARCPGCGDTIAIPGAGPEPTPPQQTAASPFAPGSPAAAHAPPLVPDASLPAGASVSAGAPSSWPSAAPPSWQAPPPMPESFNPYASPMPQPATAPLPGPPLVRDGPAWEREGKSFRSLFRTLTDFYGNPARFFLTLRREGGLGAPLGYGMAATSLAFCVWLVLGLLACGGLGLIVLSANDGPSAGEFFGIAAVVFGVIAVALPVQVLVFMFVAAGLSHATLLGLQGTRFGFETTFRVVAYTTGLCAPVLVVLVFCCGHYVWFPYFALNIVFSCIGMTHAHETSGLKATAAVLLPVGACCFVYLGLGVLLVVLDEVGRM
jgi:hypothetical protein